MANKAKIFIPELDTNKIEAKFHGIAFIFDDTRTLCGFTSEQYEEYDFKHTSSPINCAKCIDLLEELSSFKKGDKGWK